MKIPSRAAYVYLVRFPLLLAIFLIGFPASACWTNAGRSLMRGAFDMAGWQVFLASLTAFLGGWTTVINFRLVLQYGAERFGLPPVIRRSRPSGWIVPVVAVLGAFTVAGIATVYVQERLASLPSRTAHLLSDIAVPACGAFLVSVLILYVSVFVRRCFSHSEEDHFVFPLLPGWLEKPFSWADERKWKNPLRSVFAQLARFGPGYVIDEPGASDNGELESGHSYALCMTAACIVVYALCGRLERTSALACLNLVALLLCWFLSGAGFLFDYVRVPALLVLVAWLCLVSFFGAFLYLLLPATVIAMIVAWRVDAKEGAGHYRARMITGVIALALWAAAGFMLHRTSNHYFQVQPSTGQSAPNFPPEVLRGGRGTGKNVILVAAPGGGIHAAAWTAKVLVELEKACRLESDLQPRAGDGTYRGFGDSIRMISSVSGGSVGTMYFVNAYREDGRGLPDKPEELDRIVACAEASSLDSAIKGLVYPDFLKTIIPGADKLSGDRGQWLENAWVDAANSPDLTPSSGKPAVAGTQEESNPLRTATLDSWRADVAANKRPAVIFNASNADTGGRYLLATTSFKHDQAEADGDATGRLEFTEQHPKLTVKVSTAARLSATFPYVSPAACADPGLLPKNEPSPNWRLCDGGYTNNSGMYSVGEWLEQALPEPPSSPQAAVAPGPRVLIIQILNGEPSDQTAVQPINGWEFQLTAPLLTLLNVWQHGQTPHDDWEMNLLKEEYKSHSRSISSVQFIYSNRTVRAGKGNVASSKRKVGPGNDQTPPLSHPLSWHLTRGEIADIDAAWKASANKDIAARDVIDFLKGM